MQSPDKTPIFYPIVVIFRKKKIGCNPQVNQVVSHESRKSSQSFGLNCLLFYGLHRIDLLAFLLLVLCLGIVVFSHCLTDKR